MLGYMTLVVTLVALTEPGVVDMLVAVILGYTTLVVMLVPFTGIDEVVLGYIGVVLGKVLLMV